MNTVAMKKKTGTYITADDLFARVEDILNLPEGRAVNRLMHETLVLCCSEALRTEKIAFGNLFSQVDFLCKRHRVRMGDVAAIQKMRRDSNRRAPMAAEDVLYGCRALSMFISAVFGVAIPSELVGRIPPVNRPIASTMLPHAAHLRCIVDDFDETTIQATIDEDGSESPITVNYSAEHLRHLHPILRRDMQLNLLDVSREQDKADVLVPKLIVVEPDYLLDISSVAACFQPIGHHPLSYVVRYLAPNANSQALLLGNFAGRALDDVINSDGHYDWRQTLRAHFRKQALDFCTCDDLNRNEDFKQAATQQAANIVQIVNELFNTHHPSPNTRHLSPNTQQFNIQNSILEPSFVCEKLGLQGRVDLMTTDFRLLVEQKSGKNFNIERGRPNEFGSYQKEEHYVQLLLYYGILLQNFHFSTKNIDARLLYSKYPLPGGLVAVNFYQKLFHEAIALRNRIVDVDFRIATEGFDSILDQLNADTLNEKQLSSKLFEQYIKPQTEAVTAPIHRLSPLEKAYVCRMLTFCYREQLASRLGNRQKPGGGVADLWNLPLAEKKELGNIYTDLQIINKVKNDPDRGYDIITLAVPDQGENFLPNFRAGDSVYLYAYKADEEPDVRKSLLFKATLTEMSSQQITVALRDGQKNPNILVSTQKYAVEHCEIGGSAPMKAMATFASATEECRALLLGQRPPRFDASLGLSRSYHPAYDEVLLRAKQALDYFLLIGPPGTGKTSMALRFLVEEALVSDSNLPSPSGEGLGERLPSSILLTAYTNRAVDEICDMLSSAGIDYLRIGKRFSCAPRFRSHLLQQLIEDQPQLDAIRQRLLDVRVVVGTTTSLQAQPSLFAMKSFSMVIVDEASQILEPQLVGLLCQVPKFILIGDHKQLPAVVQQSEAESEVTDEKLREIGLTNCRNSLFERLLNLHTPHSTLLVPRSSLPAVGILRRQGRMHPDIAEWPNRMFYRRENLQPVPLPHQKEESKEPRIVFIPSENSNSNTSPSGGGREGASFSDKVNPSEARIVASELKKIIEEYGADFNPDKTVGVIVPYRNQISMIRREIEALAIPELLKISIDTVERYQGSQRDVIIYSTTVTHRYQLDFLCANTFVEDDAVIDRKLNVALTRARSRMIITGHEPTLRQDPLYRSLIDFIQKNTQG